MRGIEHIPLMAQALYTKEFPAIMRGIGLFSKEAELCAILIEYSQKVIEIRAYLNEIASYLVELRLPGPSLARKGPGFEKNSAPFAEKS